jgi:hypothetical protein
MLSLVGCTHRDVPIERFSHQYNEALNDSSNEQLLLNLLRLKYGETTYFMRAGNLTTSLRYSESVGLGVGAPGYNRSTESGGGGEVQMSGITGVPLAPSVDVSGSASFAPTVIMSPVLGDDLIHMYLRELDQPTLAYLLRADWDLRKLLLLIVERVGMLDNDPRGDSYPRFFRFVEEVGAVQDTGLVFFYPKEVLRDPGDPGSAVVVPTLCLVAPRAQAEAVETTIREANRFPPLQLDAARWIPVEIYTPDGERVDEVPDQGLYLATRSFHDILCHAAQGIDVPPQHVCGADSDGQDCARPVDNREGRHERWLAALDATERPLDVRWSAARARPADAYVAVRYRDLWFYVGDADAVSKKTFVLLHKIYALQSGSGAEIGTVLTIPVGAD